MGACAPVYRCLQLVFAVLIAITNAKQLVFVLCANERSAHSAPTQHAFRTLVVAVRL